MLPIIRYTPAVRLLLLPILLSLLIGCSTDGGGSKESSVAPGSGGTGQGGSMARFAVAGQYLYTVTHSGLNVYDLHQTEAPRNTGKVVLPFGVETIFPYNNHLFIGTQTGMYIFDLANPAQPR